MAGEWVNPEVEQLLAAIGGMLDEQQKQATTITVGTYTETLTDRLKINVFKSGQVYLKYPLNECISEAARIININQLFFIKCKQYRELLEEIAKGANYLDERSQTTSANSSKTRIFSEHKELDNLGTTINTNRSGSAEHSLDYDVEKLWIEGDTYRIDKAKASKEGPKFKVSFPDDENGNHENGQVIQALRNEKIEKVDPITPAPPQILADYDDLNESEKIRYQSITLGTGASVVDTTSKTNGTSLANSAKWGTYSSNSKQGAKAEAILKMWRTQIEDWYLRIENDFRRLVSCYPRGRKYLAI